MARLRDLHDRAIYGATPAMDAGSIRSWVVGLKIFHYCQVVDHPSGGRCYDFRLGTDVERRMFLLLVHLAEQSKER